MTTRKKEEAGVSPSFDEVIAQTFLRLRSGAVDALTARFDRRTGCLMNGSIHKSDFRQAMSCWRKISR
ncbi:hypothetical protein QEA29_003851 [Salmonella enterica]|nr:hypothetical protein [Salmonella enterica]EKT1325592.1 hypothetical protein [Salmonella enterica]EKT1358727.1 hypothetical protein [Salmonella enterica]EKT2634761.1 hypothetical protein [Salmonella enterica]EKT3223698.1 hypothetical protein [Salmonella enterica]